MVRLPSRAFRADFAEGARAVSPLVPAAATVGLVTGVAAVAVGLSPVQSAAMSVAVNSPTVMLAAFQLLGERTPAVVVVAAALTVGLRFVIISLSIAPYFRRLGAAWRWVLAYLLWTPAYALSVEQFEREPETSRRGYYLGTAVPLWLSFQAALVAGVALGPRVPDGWGLEFVVPLAFIALLFRMLDDRPTVGAALVAGLVAVLAAPVPLNLGIVVAAVAGTTAGVLLGGGR
jgi:predicted branched-subunit amino acid permease